MLALGERPAAAILAVVLVASGVLAVGAYFALGQETPAESALGELSPMNPVVPVGDFVTVRSEGTVRGASTILGSTVGTASIPVRVDTSKGDVTAVVIEVAWAARLGGASSFTLAYSGTEKTGPSPLRIDATYAGAREDAELRLPDGVVASEQSFTAFVTVFYDMPVPAKFTALGGS